MNREMTSANAGAPGEPKDASEGKKVLLFLPEAFEDLEAVAALSMCGWTGYRAHLPNVSVDCTGFHEVAHGRFGLSVPIDVPIGEVDPLSYDALVVPGGFHGFGFDEAYCPELRALVRAMHGNGAFVATMCVGVLPVAESGILKGGKATTYSLSSRHDNFGRLKELGVNPVKKPVVCWNGIASCSGPAYSEQVVELMLEHLVGPQGAMEIARFRKGLPG